MSNSHPETSKGLPSGAEPAFIGGGELGRLVREKDWSQTPLGPIASWPQSLLTTVNLCLASNFPIALAWGPQHVQIYNDGYWPICGDKHPHALGQDFTECWASAFPVIGDAFRSAQAGMTTFLEDQRMFLDRLGFLEETYFTFSFSPIRDETGDVVGLFHPVTETTGKMLAQRRTRTLRDLAAHGLSAQSLEEALQLSAKTLAEFNLDLPFALFYLVDNAAGTARLVSQAGLPPGGVASPAVVDLTQVDAVWPLARVAATNTHLRQDDVRERCGVLVCDPYPESIASTMVLPLTLPGNERPACILVAGVSPRLPMNAAYASFYELTAAAVSGVLASAVATEAELKRAAALAEIDRAKTEFFANVSHEFRTPLTLMLGPLEEELAEPDSALASARRERVATAHRNSLRLLKLVNALLDFSRIEADQTQASYQPTNLAAFTAELASTFRSAIEKAGLTLTVDCPPLPEPVYVDREMWEKIVLNLLSNAFKHTFEGGIRVALRWGGNHVELVVDDTGVGIPEAELPHLFERFYRVKGTRARTHEGTGIGLSLVKALVQVHGGTVQATSAEGRGTTFTVTIKTRHVHLPTDHLVAPSEQVAFRTNAAAYVEEALQWSAPLPLSAESAAASDGGSPDRRPCILWADDNADMRDYVFRLLAKDYQVITVADGAAALAAARATLPDLVLTDIMMPVLDGLGVLRELRGDARTCDIPVILLSARAGEESTLGGLGAGADDYLVKPFSANELLVKVRTRLELSRLRREAAAELERQIQQRTAELTRSEAEVRRLLVDAEDSRNSLLGILEDQQQAEAALWKSQTLLKATAEKARMGGWEIDLDSGALTWTEQIYQIYEVAPDFQPTVNGTVDFYAPESKPVIAEAVRRSIECGEPFDLELVIITAKGKRRYVHAIGEARREDGRVRRVSGTFQDITERKQAEEAFYAQAHLLSESQRMAHIGSFRWEFATGRLNWTDETYRLFGIAKGAGTPFAEALLKMVHPDDQLRHQDWMRACIAGKDAGKITHRVILPDGSVRWHLVCGGIERGPDGSPVAMVGTAQDITEQKAVEEALRQSERLYRAIGESIDYGVWVCTPDGRNIYASESWLRLVGLTQEQCSDFGWSDVLHPEDAQRSIAAWKECVRTGGKWDIEHRFFGVDGQWHPILARGVAVRNEQGQITCWAGINLDVSERHRTQEALRESEEKFRTIADFAYDWENWFGADGRAVWISPSVERVSGYTVSECEAMPDYPLPLVHEEDRAMISAVMKEGNRRPLKDMVFRLVRKDGTIRWCEVSSNQVFDSQRRSAGHRSCVRDITERRQAEAKLNEQLDELRRWHDATLGREGRVLELKREINRLLRASGHPARYASAATREDDPTSAELPADAAVAANYPDESA